MFIFIKKKEVLFSLNKRVLKRIKLKNIDYFDLYKININLWRNLLEYIYRLFNAIQ